MEGGAYQRSGTLFRSNGFAVILVDMPGTGESPVLEGRRGAAVDPVFDRLVRRTISTRPVRSVGASFGGYWAMKLATRIASG